jgi:pimeloyl-ACP methyl ester carboxylesterase
MPRLPSNSINIAYEDYGDSNNPVLLLLQGLNVPCTGWPPSLIDALVAEGYRVITPDNRDIGQSDVLDDLGKPNLLWQIVRRSLHLSVKAPYQLDDMAKDMLGLMDALGIDKAHLVGVSMGGMISQIMAIDSPHRILSLTSIMSTTNRRGLPGPTKAIRDMVVKGPADKTDEGIASFFWHLWRGLGSPGYVVPDDELRGFLGRIFDRGMTAGGTARQQTAIIAAPGRVKKLGKLTMPVQVIHGDSDPLIPLPCGIDTADAVPGAIMHTIKGMGHDLPNALTPRFTQLITSLARTAE